MKIIATFLVIVLILSALAMYSLEEGSRKVIDSVGIDSIHIAEFIASALDRTVYLKYHELLIQGKDSVIQGLLDASNVEYDGLSDPYAYMDEVESEWSSVPLTDLSEQMVDILANNASLILKGLREHYVYEHGLNIYSWIAVTNSYGAVVAMSDRVESFSQYQTEWWSEINENGSYFGDVEVDVVNGIHGLKTAVILTNETGGLKGTIFAFVDIMSVAEEAGYLEEVYQTTEMHILTPDGRLVYSSGAFDMLEDMSGEDYFLKATAQTGYFIAVENGNEKLFSYTHATGYFQYDGNDLLIFLDQRTAEVLSTVDDLNDRAMTAFILLIGLSVAMALAFTRSISARIMTLARAADEFSKGNLEGRVKVNGSDEVAQLAVALNDMATELDGLYKGLEARVQERTNELEQATRKLRLLGSITRHDGLNQVAVISAWTSVLEETAEDDKEREILERVKEAAGALERYLTFTGTYEQIGVERPTWIHMGDALTNGLFGIDLQGANLHRDLEGIHVYADPMLPRVLRNLVDNSLKHGGGVKKMSFGFEESPDGLRIVYEDDGKGVPDDMKSTIFERPVRSGRRSFGLYLSREILSITGITIREAGTAGKGARFEILVPEGRFRIAQKGDGDGTATGAQGPQAA